MSLRRSGRSRGQAMVEFALIAPFFFMILFSIIEFGRAVYYIQMLNNAAREGARYAIVHGADSQCASGPFPAAWGKANLCDADGSNVVGHTKQFAIGIIDSTGSDFDVSVRWCDGIDTSPAGCPDTNSVGAGDGDNSRGQNVRVEIDYLFRPLIAGVIPLPEFTLTGGSTLVINH